MKGCKIRPIITDLSELSIQRYFKQISKYPVLSVEEEIKVIKRLLNGDKVAKELLINSNLRFVVTVAKQYQHCGLPLADLIQEGNIGLCKAVDMFDLSKGVKFITYAFYWIKQSIMQAIANVGRTIRLPSTEHINIDNINKASLGFAKLHNRMPTSEELSEMLGNDSYDIICSLLSAKKVLSLDVPLDISLSDDTLADYVEGSIDPLDNVNQKDLRLLVHDMLGLLPERSRKIVSLFYGINCDQKTMQQIAKIMHLSRERVRLLLVESLQYLRVNGEEYLTNYL